MGGAALEASYGYNLAGNLPPEYTARFSNLALFSDAAQRALLGMGALWLGWAWVIWQLATRRPVDRVLIVGALVYVPLVLLATFLLSSRVARVIGITFPVLIPPLMMLLKRTR